VEIVSYAWQDLLTELARNSVDVVISSVTATKNREQEFGILFSKGYYVTHQMLLSNQLTYDSNRSLFENLRKKRIGVLKGTTNERAANYVAEKCKCEMEISASFLELIESKNALFRRDVDLLLTDDIWLTGQSNMGTFSQYGSTLDDELRDFYTQEYGRSQEEYGIAVSKNGGDDLIPVINEILSTPKAKQFLDASEARARAKGQIASGSR
jgi:ABC-type amino acid transport substrate-binding protein